MRTKIFGHRGYPAKFPENSLEGFDYCMHHGAEGIEFDVHLTRDGVPVIMHDENIKRTTNGKGLIKDFSLAELDQFHLANGERIPRLKDLFQLTEESGYEGQLNLEMKTNKFDYPGLPEKIFALADQFKFKQEIIYSSFNLQTLIHAQKIRPEENYNFLGPTSGSRTRQLLSRSTALRGSTPSACSTRTRRSESGRWTVPCGPRRLLSTARPAFSPTSSKI